MEEGGDGQEQHSSSPSSPTTATNDRNGAPAGSNNVDVVPNVPNWKQVKQVFKHDTEAGRLLSRLYGYPSNSSNSSNSNRINYPKIKTKAPNCSREDLSQRVPWNQQKKQDSSSISRRRKSAAVKVPRVGVGGGGGSSSTATSKTNSLTLDKIPRRKTQASCKNTLENNFLLSSNYRPPCKVLPNDIEKERLCELHEYGGGHALPEELTLPKRALPSDILKATSSSTQAKQQANVNVKVNANKREQDGDNDTVVNQIVKEIEERRRFQREMEEMGCGQATRAKIVKEISDRMKELSMLDKGKFNALRRE